jgi:hypothetical protein
VQQQAVKQPLKSQFPGGDEEAPTRLKVTLACCRGLVRWAILGSKSDLAFSSDSHDRGGCSEGL